MTIALGLMCNHGNTMLLSADTMISYGSTSSNAAGGKLYKSDVGIYLAVADDVSYAHVVANEFIQRIDKLDKEDQLFGAEVEKALIAASDSAFKRWRGEALRAVNLTEDEYLHGNLDSSKRADAEESLANAKRQGLPIEMIVAGYGKHHRIFMYTDGLHINQQSSPGILIAGSGFSPAQDWLNFRAQNSHMPWEVSYYHMLEAVRFAEVSRGVGEN